MACITRKKQRIGNFPKFCLCGTQHCTYGTQLILWSKFFMFLAEEGRMARSCLDEIARRAGIWHMVRNFCSFLARRKWIWRVAHVLDLKYLILKGDLVFEERVTNFDTKLGIWSFLQGWRRLIQARNQVWKHIQFLIHHDFISILPFNS
jgi:hypothetical protein